MSSSTKENPQDFDIDIFLKLIGERKSVMQLLPVMATQLSIKAMSIKQCIDKNNDDKKRRNRVGCFN